MPTTHQLMSSTPRRSSGPPGKRPSTPLTLSPTLSTLSSLSSSSPDLGLLSHAFSPASDHSDSTRKLFPTPSATDLHHAHVLDRSAHHLSGSPSAQAKGKGKAAPPPPPPAPKKVRKERQTRIQEHLRTVKPGSPSPSASSAKSSSSTKHPKPARIPKRHAPAAVVEPADDVELEPDLADAVDPAQEGPVGEPLSPAAAAGRLDVAAMAEEEVQARLKQEKEELMATLASHGCVTLVLTHPRGSTIAPLLTSQFALFFLVCRINPHPDVLDHVLRTMATGDGEDGVTVDSFLQALSSLDSTSPHGTPVAPDPSPARTTSHGTRSGSFNTLESPSTPSRSASSRTGAFPLSSPSPSTSAPRAATRSSRRAPPTTPTPSSSFANQSGVFPSALEPSPEIVTASPAELRNGRLHAFGMRRSNSAMVAAEVQGMGRVALAREVLVERLGPDTAEQAIAAAGTPLLPLAFGHVLPRASLPALEAFRPAPFLGRKPQPSQVAAKGPVVDERLGLVRSWLESSPDLADDDAPETWSAVPTEWDEDFEPAHRTRSSKSQSLEEPAPTASDADEMLDQPDEIRVGGKSVRLLVRSKRRRVEEDEGLDVDSNDPDVDMEMEEDAASTSTSSQHTTMRRQASKSRAVPVEPSTSASVSVAAGELGCFCGCPDEEDTMVQCDDCRVWYHLACLRITSAKQLPKRWFCTRCEPSETIVPERAAPPGKRLRLAQPTTPVFYREPTFVSGPPSPRVKGNFYHNSAADVVLAPSPQTSPSRRFAPQSPVHQHAPTPVTPQFGHIRAADYAPRSPLFFRAGRSRMVSGAFDDLPAVQGGWVSSWDGHVFGVEEPLAPLDGDSDFWRDMTLTPSRSLSSSAFGWEAGIQTPTSGARRTRLASGALIPSTPSQDFFSNIDAHPDPLVAQRLFGSPAAHHSPAPSHFTTPASPLSKGTRARIPSAAFFAQSPGSRLGQSFTSDSFSAGHSRRVSASRSAQYDSMPSPKIEERKSAVATKREIHDQAAEVVDERKSPSPAQLQAPTMGRSNSGLGMNFATCWCVPCLVYFQWGFS
ncbi:hypothetical protein RQP46_005519 [Phenoliferia psychrophenolica]